MNLNTANFVVGNISLMNYTLISVDEALQRTKMVLIAHNRITTISILIVVLFYFRIIMLNYVLPKFNFREDFKEVIIGSIECIIVSIGWVQICLCLTYL